MPLEPATRLIELARSTAPMHAVIGRSSAQVVRGTLGASRSEAELRSEVLRAAIHESGHAVADAVLYGPGVLRFATLEHEGEFHGYTERFRSDLPPIHAVRLDGADAHAGSVEMAKVDALGLSAYAGGAAELFAPFAPECAVWRPGKPMASALRKRFDECSLMDRKTFEHNARVISGREFPARELHVGLFLRTMAFLCERWRLVHAVAEQLCSAGTLDGADVDRLVQARPPGSAGESDPGQ